MCNMSTPLKFTTMLSNPLEMSISIVLRQRQCYRGSGHTNMRVSCPNQDEKLLFGLLRLLLSEMQLGGHSG